MSAENTVLSALERRLLRGGEDRALRSDVLNLIARAVPFDAFAWLLTDPVTTVGTAPLANVPCIDRLARLVALRYTAAARWNATGADKPHRAVPPGSELARFISDYGSYDLVTVGFTDKFGCWGFLDLWRRDVRFSDEELQLLAAFSGPVTAALRRAQASSFALPAAPTTDGLASVVLLLGPDLLLRRQSSEADAALRALLPTPESRQPVPAAAYNVAAQLLANEAGIDPGAPSARAWAGAGRFISLEASRLGEDIAVTIGPVGQRERWDLFSRAHGLSARETEVLSCLAEGDDTRSVATRLHLSQHTVQDHLKTIFAKAVVRSRRELLARARGT